MPPAPHASSRSATASPSATRIARRPALSRIHALPSAAPTNAAQLERAALARRSRARRSACRSPRRGAVTSARSAVSARSVGLVAQRGDRRADARVAGARLDRERALAGGGNQLVAARSSRCGPSRRSPAHASTIASKSPSLRRASRVSTLPCSGATSRSSRSASSCAAAAGCSFPRARRPAAPRATRAPHSASRGSSRARRAGDHQAGAELRRQILRRVHREVDLAGEQRVLDRVDPAALVAARAAVAAGAQHDRLDLAVDRAATSAACAQRERAAARARAAALRRRAPAHALAPRAQRARTLSLRSSAVVVRSASARRRCRRLRLRARVEQGEQVAQQLDAAVDALGVEAFAGGSSARAAGAARRRARAPRRAPGRAADADSQRPAFSASTCSTIVSPRSRSARDRRAHVELAEPVREALDLLADDLLGRRDVGGAAREVARDGGLEVVDVAQRDALESARTAGRCRAARRCRSAAAAAALARAITSSSSSWPTIGCGEEVDASTMSAASSVSGRRSRPTTEPPKRSATERARSAWRLAMKIVAHAAGGQRLGGQLARLAGADHHDGPPAEIAEQALRQLDRDGGEAHVAVRAIAVSSRTRLPVCSAAANRRLVSGPVVPAVARSLVRAPDLALDLVLADDHRVEPRGHAEQVPRGVAVARRVSRLARARRRAISACAASARHHDLARRRRAFSRTT